MIAQDWNRAGLDFALSIPRPGVAPVNRPFPGYTGVTLLPELSSTGCDRSLINLEARLCLVRERAPGRRDVAKLLSYDETRRIAADIATIIVSLVIAQNGRVGIADFCATNLHVHSPGADRRSVYFRSAR
jgi:hypothetical protein